jgi:SHS2 domain-containing protein
MGAGQWVERKSFQQVLPRGTPHAEFLEKADMTIHRNAKKETLPEGESAGFEEVDHTADAALKLWAPDFESLLVQAAWGAAWILTGSMLSGPFPIRKHLALEAFDRESMLVAWLGELAYLAEADRELFVRFEFDHITSRRLIAVAEGIRVPSLKTVIKAVTYHDLEVVETERGLETTVVFDV